MRDLTPKGTDARVAACDQTYIVSLPLVTVIGCCVCGGSKQLVLHLQSDWTTSLLKTYEEHYQAQFFPCSCHATTTTFNALHEQLDALKRENAALHLTNGSLENSNRLLRSLMEQPDGARETGEVAATVPIP